MHTGQHVTLTFLSAAANHGIKFQRIDLKGQPIIPADADLVTTVVRGTTLEKGNGVITTVEHCLAAVTASMIDNILIQSDGMEELLHSKFYAQEEKVF